MSQITLSFEKTTSTNINILDFSSPYKTTDYGRDSYEIYLKFKNHFEEKKINNIPLEDIGFVFRTDEGGYMHNPYRAMVMIIRDIHGRDCKAMRDYTNKYGRHLIYGSNFLGLSDDIKPKLVDKYIQENCTLGLSYFINSVYSEKGEKYFLNLLEYTLNKMKQENVSEKDRYNFTRWTLDMTMRILLKESSLFLLNELQQYEEYKTDFWWKEDVIFFVMDAHRGTQKQILEFIKMLHEKHNFPVHFSCSDAYQGCTLYSPLEIAFACDWLDTFNYLINEMKLDKKEAYKKCKKEIRFEETPKSGRPKIYRFVFGKSYRSNYKKSKRNR